MSFENNPADDDPHGECRNELHLLQSDLDNMSAVAATATVMVAALTGLLRAADRSHTFAFPGDLQRRIGEALNRIESRKVEHA